MFYRLISHVFRQVKYQQNMRNEENICPIVQAKRSVARLFLTYEIYTPCLFIIY